MAKKKKSTEKKARVHKELEGFEIKVNPLGEITSNYDIDQIKALLLQILEQKGMKIGQVMQALRLALTGLEAGPDLMAIIEIIGREETARRIDAAIAKLQPYAG